MVSSWLSHGFSKQVALTSIPYTHLAETEGCGWRARSWPLNALPWGITVTSVQVLVAKVRGLILPSLEDWGAVEEGCLNWRPPLTQSPVEGRVGARRSHSGLWVRPFLHRSGLGGQVVGLDSM